MTPPELDTVFLVKSWIGNVQLATATCFEAARHISSGVLSKYYVSKSFIGNIPSEVGASDLQIPATVNMNDVFKWTHVLIPSEVTTINFNVLAATQLKYRVDMSMPTAYKGRLINTYIEICTPE